MYVVAGSEDSDMSGGVIACFFVLARVDVSKKKLGLIGLARVSVPGHRVRELPMLENSELWEPARERTAQEAG